MALGHARAAGPEGSTHVPCERDLRTLIRRNALMQQFPPFCSYVASRVAVLLPRHRRRVLSTHILRGARPWRVTEFGRRFLENRRSGKAAHSPCRAGRMWSCNWRTAAGLRTGLAPSALGGASPGDRIASCFGSYLGKRMKRSLIELAPPTTLLSRQRGGGRLLPLLEFKRS